jgi:excinuclease ABC subunit B
MLLRESSENFDVTEMIRELEKEMLEAADNLEFEKAALLRDQVNQLNREIGEAMSEPDKKRRSGSSSIPR